MRILLLLLTFSSFSFAQNEKITNLLTDTAPCTFELTIDELISDELKFECFEIFENKTFRIENFRIKFRGHASISISGNSLDMKSEKLAKNLKIGDSLTIFHIENMIVDGEKSQDFKTMNIKIVKH